MARSWLRASAAFAGALALGAAFLGGYAVGVRRGSSPPPLPVLGRAPAYTLVNQRDQTVASSHFIGKVQLVTFLAPYCTGYCPLIAYDLVRLERVLKAAGLADRVQLVAFNVDPEHAGPPAMAAFLEQYGWDPHDTRWQYLTGDAETIRRVVTRGFSVDYREVPESQQGDETVSGRSLPQPVVANPLAKRAGVDYDIVHNDVLVFVDPMGRIRAFRDEADRVSEEEMLALINRLLGAGSPP